MVDKVILAVCISAVLTFAVTIMTSMAAGDIVSGDYSAAHRRATQSAVVTGLTTLGLLGTLGVYIYRDKVGSYLKEYL